MALVAMVDRQRGIQRTRPRPNARGNFITLRIFATVFTITFASTDLHYIKWIPYRHPFSKAIGFVDNPAPVPALVPLGPIARTELVHDIEGIPTELKPILPTPDIVNALPNLVLPPILIPSATLITAQPILTQPSIVAEAPQLAQKPLAEGVTAQQPQPFKAGDAFQIDVTTTLAQIFKTEFLVKQVWLKAKSTNGASIWFGYKKIDPINNGWELTAGEGVIVNIDDLSDIWLKAESGTQKLQVKYLV